MDSTVGRFARAFILALALVLVSHLAGEFMSKNRPVVGPGTENATTEAEEPAPAEKAAAKPAPDPAPVKAAALAPTAPPPVIKAVVAGNAEKGAKVARKCLGCHSLIKGDTKKKVGPNLFGLIGRPAGSVQGFRYSSGLRGAAASIGAWDAAKLDAYLADPTTFLRKASENDKARSAMAFRLKKSKERTNVIAYLATLSE